jgi:NADH:ubiquinone oxidoreductase subunit E
MKIMICIGSSCHIRGSYNVVNKLKTLINDDVTVENVDLCGSFCMGECGKGVCIKIDDKKYIVDEDNVLDFYNEHIKK